MNNVKVSVIIPVYNVEKYLCQCLDSVINQTIKDIEVICVNDGSTDNCPKILDEYAKKDLRIKVLHKKNEGQGVSRNKALEIAKGQYILFLDSDDWLEKDALEKLYQKFNKDNSDVIFFNAYKYFEKTKTKNVYYFADPYYTKFGENVFSPLDAKDILYLTTAIPLKIYRKDSLIKYNFKYTNHRCWEDHLPFFTFLAKCEKISVLNECLYNYRVREDSTTHNSFKYLNDCIETFCICFDEMNSNERTRLFIKQFLEYRITSIFFHFNISNFWSKRKIYKVMQKIFKYIKENYPKNIDKDYFYYKNYKLVKKLPFLVYYLITKTYLSYIIFKSSI